MGRRPLTRDGSTVVYQFRLPAALRAEIKARGGAAWIRELVEAAIAGEDAQPTRDELRRVGRHLAAGGACELA